jgi:hypothetical protein
MNIYTNTSFTGHWPVGTAAVVRAENAEEAAEILTAELRNHGLRDTVSADEMTPLPKGKCAVVLNDGDY